MEDKRISSIGGVEKCLFCAVPIVPNFTVLNGRITRLKKEAVDADPSPDDDCCPVTPSSSFLKPEQCFLDNQLQVIFILRNILHIPEKKLCKFLKKFGGQLHPEFWIQVCSPCEESVLRFYKTLKEISVLRRRLTKISTLLKDRIYDTREVVKAAEGITGIWEEIRAEVLQDFEEISTTDDDDEVDRSKLKSNGKLESFNNFAGGMEKKMMTEDDDPLSDFNMDDEVDNDDDDNSSSFSNSEEDDCTPKPSSRTRILRRKGKSSLQRKLGRPLKHSPPVSRPGPLSKKRKEGPYSSQYSIFHKQRSKGRVPFYRCNLCSFSKADKRLIIEHLGYHERGEGSACPKCGWFIPTGKMGYHNAAFHIERKPHGQGDKPTYVYTCEKCGARFKDKRYLNEHKTLHESGGEGCTNCKLCGWLVKNKLLRRHEINHHSSSHHGERADDADKPKKDKKPVKIMPTDVEFGDYYVPYYCDHCPMIYTNKTYFQKHFVTYHADKVGFVPCTEDDCEEEFESKQLLKFHLERAHSIPHENRSVKEEKGEEKCPHCEAVFDTKLRVDYHIAKKHLEILLTCTTCNIKHNSYQLYKRHMETTKAHSTTQTFSCELCGKSYWGRDRLKHHRRKEHFQELGLDPIQCKECGIILSDQKVLDAHVLAVHRKERNFSCEYCGKAFSFPNHLQCHINRFHKGPLGTLEMPGEKHFRLEKKENNDGDGDDDAKEEKWLCDFCPVPFPNLQAVRTHLLSVHYDELKYSCEGCGKKFCASLGLHQHRKSCSDLNYSESANGENPPLPESYSCEFCSKIFNSYEKRYKHQRREHKDRYSHKCQNCDKVFRSLSNLILHQNTCVVSEAD